MVGFIYYITAGSSWKFHQLAAGQLRQGGWNGTEKAGGTARPLLTKSHLPGHSPPAGKAGRHSGQCHTLGISTPLPLPPV
jgi:hypothetical protein